MQKVINVLAVLSFLGTKCGAGACSILINKDSLFLFLPRQQQKQVLFLEC